MIFHVVLVVLQDVKVVVNLLVLVGVVAVVLAIVEENVMVLVAVLVDSAALAVVLAVLCFLFIVN